MTADCFWTSFTATPIEKLRFTANVIFRISSYYTTAAMADHRNVPSGGKTFDYEDFNPDDFRTRKRIRGGKTSVVVTYINDITAFRFQTPAQDAPFGVSCWEGGNTGAVDATGIQKRSYKLTINVTDPDYIDFCNKLDDLVIQLAVKNSKDWFGVQKSLEVISDNYYRVLRPATGDYAPTNKFTVLTTPESRSTRFYTPDQKPITRDDVKSHSRVVIIAEAPSIYFMGKSSFGLSLVARQVCVIPELNMDFAFDISDPTMRAAIDTCKREAEGVVGEVAGGGDGDSMEGVQDGSEDPHIAFAAAAQQQGV